MVRNTIKTAVRADIDSMSSASQNVRPSNCCTKNETRIVRYPYTGRPVRRRFQYANGSACFRIASSNKLDPLITTSS